MSNNYEELIAIISKFAESGWDLIDAPSKAWISSQQDRTAIDKLTEAINEADKQCGSCGCDFDALYKRALTLFDIVKLIKDAELLLSKCDTVSLSSVTGKGYPRICIMAKIKAEGCKTIYFSTGTNSAKTNHYRNNPKAGVAFYDGGDSVTLIGEVTIVEDKATKDALWQDWFINHFAQGKDDPGYAIIRFDACEATIYINGRFETVEL